LKPENLDHIFLAIHNFKESIRIHQTDIAGAKPLLRKETPSLSFANNSHDLRASGHKSPRFHLEPVISVIIKNCHFGARHGQAYCSAPLISIQWIANKVPAMFRSTRILRRADCPSSPAT